MADSKREAPTWLQNPPEPGNTHFYLELGEGVSLTAAAQAALETLSKELIGQEASGLSRETANMAKGKCDICKGDCIDYSHKLCNSYDICKICDSNCATMT